LVCKEGDCISPQGAILLRLFGHELATFKMDLLCGWVRLFSAFLQAFRGIEPARFLRSGRQRCPQPPSQKTSIRQ
jgi:hypothetical protein